MSRDLHPQDGPGYPQHPVDKRGPDAPAGLHLSPDEAFVEASDSDRDIDPYADSDSDSDEGAEEDSEDIGDLAQGALQAARLMSSGSGPRTSPGVRGRGRRSSFRSRQAPTYSGARPDERDPAALGNVLRHTAASLGWAAPLARARVLGQWSDIVGSAIADHCQPTTLNNSELRISAESTAWATQLRLMAPQILARLAAELPAGTVTKLVITGPTGPSWRRGPWSMSGGRGVRDTYG